MSEQSLSEPQNVIQPAGARQAPGPVAARLPYSNNRRVGYGLLWAGWTAVLVIAGFTGLFGGQILGGLVALALGALAGRYDYRIWTWQARRLLFFIIF
jgi:hypothetical protein